MNVIDINNKILDADLICANKTDSDNCDLYFNAQLTNYSLNYFKLAPNPTPQTKTIES